MPDLEFAHAVLVLDCEPVDDMPILDLRIRKGVRRHGVRLAVATRRPSSLDPNADGCRCASRPGAGEAFARRAERRAGRRAATLDALRRGRRHRPPTPCAALAALAARRRRGRRDLYGERLLRPARRHAARALLNVAARLELGGRDGAGLLEIPAGANGRGLREAGLLPGAGPGYADVAAGAAPPRSPRAGRRRADRALPAARRPAARPPDRAPGSARSSAPRTVVAHAAFLTEGSREHADVVFPAESYAEKEGTVVHPDGRLQRLRPRSAIPARRARRLAGARRPRARLGHDTGVLTGADGLARSCSRRSRSTPA